MLIKKHSGRKLLFGRLLENNKIFTILLLMVAFISGGIFYREVYVNKEMIKRKIVQSFYAPLIKGKMIASNARLPDLIQIDIKHLDYQKLAYNREIALQRAGLFADCRDEVPASIRYNNKTYKVKLRLKGDLSDHWKDRKKWSFRVRTKREDTLFGMREFSLQAPSTRRFLNEWVFHKLLKYNGLIALRYFFVEVIVNGDNLGIYAVEEGFDKQLLEHNGRREGPIVKYDDYLLWHDKSYAGRNWKNPNLQIRNYDMEEVYATAPVVAYHSKNIKADSTLSNQAQAARNLLEAFRRGELSVSEAFDIERLAELFAVVHFVGGFHALAFANIRYYYNPIIDKLEAIGYDNNSISKISIVGHKLWELNYFKPFFQDKHFMKIFLQCLLKYSNKQYLDVFFAEIDSELNYVQQVLKISYPAYSFEGKNLIYYNQLYLNKLFNPPRCAQAYISETDRQRIRLQVGNTQILPLKVEALVYQDSIRFFPKQDSCLYLDSRFAYKPVVFSECDFYLPDNFTFSDTTLKDLFVEYKLLPNDKIIRTEIQNLKYQDASIVKQDTNRKKPNTAEFDFLQLDNDKTQITIKKGDWTLSRDLVIPPDYLLVAGSGTSLNLIDSASVISYSPLYILATENEPFQVFSSDSTGQGLFVFNCSKPSLLKNVVFENLGNPAHNVWALTGAVTFYRAPVNIESCRFLYMRCEDALNIVNTSFEINNSTFQGSQGDAFDGDFVHGTISNTSFLNCGNDAIDVSGSTIEASGITIDGVGDKGISAGENSYLTILNASLKNCEIAFTSKDLSKMIITNSQVNKSRVAICVFQKKPEYGPAEMFCDNVSMNETEQDFLLESGSRLLLDKQEMEPNRKSVKDILYGVEYGKKSGD